MNTILEEVKAYFDFYGIDAVPQEVYARCLEVTAPSDRASAPQGEELSIERLRAQALQCESCRLHETRTTVVFGSGETQSPPIAFVGEAPGADEDRIGEPFVGKAGELLNAAITKGLKLRRDQVYICNVLKCRPPQNRTPMIDEVERCRGYLEAQLRLVRPKVIVTLGAPALRTLTGLEGGITRLRGNWHEWEGIALLPTFHPAYILRNPNAKRAFWEDLQNVMQRLGW